MLSGTTLRDFVHCVHCCIFSAQNSTWLMLAVNKFWLNVWQIPFICYPRSTFPLFPGSSMDPVLFCLLASALTEPQQEFERRKDSEVRVFIPLCQIASGLPYPGPKITLFQGKPLYVESVFPITIVYLLPLFWTSLLLLPSGYCATLYLLIPL